MELLWASYPGANYSEPVSINQTGCVFFKTGSLSLSLTQAMTVLVATRSYTTIRVSLNRLGPAIT